MDAESLKRSASEIEHAASVAEGQDFVPLKIRLDETRDVTITPADLEELKAELQGCPPCLEFVESLKTTVKLCRGFGVGHAVSPLAADSRSKMVEAYERMLARRAGEQTSASPHG